MQRRTVPTNGPAQDDPDEVHEVVNLLHTDVRAEYQKPPLHSRIKSFMLQNYRPARLLPVIKWLPAYAGKGPGGWRENLYGDVFAGCTVAYVPVPARHAQCGGCERIKSPGSACLRLGHLRFRMLRLRHLRAQRSPAMSQAQHLPTNHLVVGTDVLIMLS